jgi:hypothetical protein
LEYAGPDEAYDFTRTTLAAAPGTGRVNPEGIWRLDASD